MNWRLKILSKIILTRLPIAYRVWKRMGMFQHGNMNDAGYAEKVFNMHFAHFAKSRPQGGFKMLELGPGDSILSALYGYLNGAGAVYLMDVGRFASTNLSIYKTAYDKWCAENVMNRPEPDFGSVNGFLSSVNAQYFVGGLKDFNKISTQSIDFIYSHSVLEHVRVKHVDDLISELFRISKPGAICSHNIDYMDHLGGGQNNLRFSDAIWESEFFAKSGFYTNRIPAHIMHQKIQDAGFNIIQEQFGIWASAAMENEDVSIDLRDDYSRDLSAPTSSIILSK